MTREEYIEDYNFGNTKAIVRAEDLIDRIINDFESRTCENCKYSEHTQTLGVGIKRYKCSLVEGRHNSKFGCSYFERKTDGNV